MSEPCHTGSKGCSQPGRPTLPRSCLLEQLSSWAVGAEETRHILKGRLHVLFITCRGKTRGETGLGIRGDAMVRQTSVLFQHLLGAWAGTYLSG